MQTILSSPLEQKSIPKYAEMEDGPLMGSRNHSYVQGNLVIAFSQLQKYVVLPELSLEVAGKEYKPDICLYPEEYDLPNLAEDVIKETCLPLLAVEILSPRQVMMDIMTKFKAYFEAGIPSAWIVIPSGNTVLVYSDLFTANAFSSGNVIDEKLNIRLPLNSVFHQRKHLD